MSLLQKPQMIHIIAEIVVFISLAIYFSQKNKKIMGHMNDLLQRLEEQEDIIHKHEKMIVKLSNTISELYTTIGIINHNQNTISSNKRKTNLHPKVEELINDDDENFKNSENNNITKSSKNNEFNSLNLKKNENIIENEIENEIENQTDDIDISDNEQNLDNEILEELKDLEE